MAVLFALALTIRAYPVLRSPEPLRYGFGPFGDSTFYHVTAYNLTMGRGFSGTDDGRAFGLRPEDQTLECEPAITRGPMYSFFMAAVYRSFGDRDESKTPETWRVDWDRVRLAQCVLDSIVAVLVFFIVRLLCPGRVLPAAVAAFVYGISPYNLFYTRALLSEALTTFLLTGTILLSVLALAKDRAAWCAAAGAALGMTILSRAEYMLFPFVLGGYLLFVHRRNVRRGAACALMLLGGTCLVVAPWTLRNYREFHRVIPVCVGPIGSALFLGSFETGETWKDWEHFPESLFDSEQERLRVESSYRSLCGHAEAGSIELEAVDREFLGLAVARIREHPWECVRTWLMHVPRLWYQGYIQMYAYREASGWFFLVYFGCAIFAFLRAARGTRVLMGVVGLLFVYLTLVLMPIHIEPRYGVALMPGIIALAGIGIWRVFAGKDAARAEAHPT